MTFFGQRRFKVYDLRAKFQILFPFAALTATDAIHDSEVREKCGTEEIGPVGGEPLACPDKFGQESGDAIVAMGEHGADEPIDTRLRCRSEV